MALRVFVLLQPAAVAAAAAAAAAAAPFAESRA